MQERLFQTNPACPAPAPAVPGGTMVTVTSWQDSEGYRHACWVRADGTEIELDPMRQTYLRQSLEEQRRLISERRLCGGLPYRSCGNTAWAHWIDLDHPCILPPDSVLFGRGCCGRIRFAPERADVTGLRCPSTRRQDTDLIGCGSANVSGPDEEGLCDCHDCGLFFRPEAVNV